MLLLTAQQDCQETLARCSDTLCAHGFLFCICFILSFRSGLRAVFLEMYVIAGFAEVT